jgi:hypothetical protein
VQAIRWPSPRSCAMGCRSRQQPRSVARIKRQRNPGPPSREVLVRSCRYPAHGSPLQSCNRTKGGRYFLDNASPAKPLCHRASPSRGTHHIALKGDQDEFARQFVQLKLNKCSPPHPGLPSSLRPTPAAATPTRDIPYHDSKIKSPRPRGGGAGQYGLVLIIIPDDQPLSMRRVVGVNEARRRQRMPAVWAAPSRAQRMSILVPQRQRNRLITLAIFAGQFGRLKAMYSPE